MAPRDREERMLMRQRGAGTHKLADVSFGIDVTLPEIAPPAPQTSPTPRRRSRRGKTPTGAPQDKPSEVQQPTTGATTPPRAVGSKRKSQGPASVQKPPTPDQPSTSVRSTRSSGVPTSDGLSHRSLRSAKAVADGEFGSSPPRLRKRPSTTRKKDVLDLTDEEREEAEAQSKSTKERVRTAGTKVAQPRKSERLRVEEAKTSQANLSLPGRKRGVQRKSDVAGSESIRHEGEQEQEIEKGVSPKGFARNGRFQKPRESSVVSPIAEEPDLEMDPIQESVSRVGQTSREHGRASTSPIVIEDDDSQDDEMENALERNRQRGRVTESLVQPRSKKARKVQRSSIAASTAQARPREHTRQRKANVPSRARPRDSGHQASNYETVPILVHRLSTHHHGDYGGEDAVFNPNPPHSNRTTVNAVDVLSQICRELITGSVEKLHQGAEQEEDTVRLGEWNRKRKAVEAFGEELEERLFEMTEALDYNYVLALRLRKANKEKLRLREKLLQIKQERELMALRMDEVRRKHEESMKAAENRDALNTAFHDIEVAVERGRARQQKQSAEDGDTSELPDLEARLMSIADNVSSTSDMGSLLGRVKEFNAFLERAAAVLEGRM